MAHNVTLASIYQIRPPTTEPFLQPNRRRTNNKTMIFNTINNVMKIQGRRRSWIVERFNKDKRRKEDISPYTLRRLRVNDREITITEALIFAKIFDIEDFRDLLIIKLNNRKS